jgi:hypothetical protein
MIRTSARFVELQLLGLTVAKPATEEAEAGVVAWLELLIGPIWISEVSLHGSLDAGWSLRFGRDENCAGAHASPVSPEAEQAILQAVLANLQATPEWEWIASA